MQLVLGLWFRLRCAGLGWNFGYSKGEGFLGKGWAFGRVRITVKVKVRIKVRAGYRVVTQEGRQRLQSHLRGRWGVRVRDMVKVRV